MSFFNWLGGIFDPEDQDAANAAHDVIGQQLAPDSPYWQSGQVNDDQHVITGAAGLKNTNIGYNSGAVDLDAKKDALLAGLYGDIYQNGGKLAEAAKQQAASDLANTASSKLDAASRSQAANVLAVDQAERNGAASGQTTARGQELAIQLQKQLWNTAVSHANFEASLAGQGLENSDKNLQTELALALQQGAIGATASQSSANRAMNQTNFNNTLGALQAIGGMAANGAGTIASMSSTGAGGTAGTGVSTGTTYSPSTGTVLGSQANLGTGQSTQTGNYDNLSLSPMPTMSKYVNPITGNTVDSNLPDEHSWGDWLVDNSSLASV